LVRYNRSAEWSADVEEKCHVQGFADATRESRKREMLPELIRRNLVRIYHKVRPSKPRYGDKSDYQKPTFEPLNLQPGEKVRVKALEEIAKTLDKDNKYQGLSFFAPMEKFCGGTYTVHKRVEKVFNERRWTMSRIKNVVLLEGVFCDGKGGVEKLWDGCDRSCYLWWKEAWLERVEE
jgi:hypothetical protein